MRYLLLASLIIPALAGDVSLLPPQPAGTVFAAVQTDTDGNMYTAGYMAPNHPTADDFGDAFVAKLAPDGSQIFKTVLAGSKFEMASTIALAADGSIYAAGVTESSDFPVTSKALQQKLGSNAQAFIAKLSPSGQVQSATYFGGGAGTWGNALAIASTGEVFLTGTSSADGFPATAGNTGAGNGFYLAKFDAGLQELLLATRANGGTVLTLDSQGNIYVAGSVMSTNGIDAPLEVTAGAFQTSVQVRVCGGNLNFGISCSYQFVAKLDPTATKLSYATFLSGSFGASPAGIAADAAGNAIVAGTTNSSDYPVTPEALQTLYTANAVAPFLITPHPPNFPPPSTGYVTKLNATGTALIWSTFFGGSEQDAISGMALGPNGYIYITGQANSKDLPGFSAIVPSACRPSVSQGLGFVARLSPDGSSVSPTKLVYGAPSCIYTSCALDISATSSNAWVVAAKPDGTAIAAGDNGAIATIDLLISSGLACLTDPADGVQITKVAPGQLVSIFGTRIATESVKFNGIAAPILYMSGEQINVQIPYEIAGEDSVEVEVEGITERRTVAVVPRQPSVFLAQDALLAPVPGFFHCDDETASRNQHALALNEDGTLNTCANGAKPGSKVTIFMNGIGQTQPAQVTGAMNPAPAVKLIPAATGSSIISTTTSPGSISGVAQVHVRANTGGFVEVAPAVDGVPSHEPIAIWVATRH